MKQHESARRLWDAFKSAGGSDEKLDEFMETLDEVKTEATALQKTCVQDYPKTDIFSLISLQHELIGSSVPGQERIDQIRSGMHDLGYSDDEIDNAIDQLTQDLNRKVERILNARGV